MGKASVSVILPVYNEERHIKQCIESLLAQTQPLEIIVVDDGSTDNSAALIGQFTHNDSIVLMRQKHLGAGSARNVGASRASGDILVFVDADMTFDDSFVKNLVKPINAGKTIGTFSKDEYLSNTASSLAVCWNLDRGLPADRMHPANYPDKQQVFRAILRSEFVRCGGFNPKAGYSDDYTLSQRLGIQAVVAPNAVFYHSNPDSLSELFIQARWMAKRKYKLGSIGSLITLIRSTVPISLILGVVKAIKYHRPTFVVFKLAKDFGTLVGVLEHVWLGKNAK